MALLLFIGRSACVLVADRSGRTFGGRRRRPHPAPITDQGRADACPGTVRRPAGLPS